jgi:hypothetical protein
MINRAKLRQFDGPDYLNQTPMTCNDEISERKTLELPNKNQLSDSDFAELPREEIENYRKEREQIFKKI